MRTFAPVLLTALTAMTAQAQAEYSATTLADLRDHARPFLVFAGESDTRVEQQYVELVTHANEARDRDLRVVLLTTSQTRMHDGNRPPENTFSPEEQGQLRRRFHVATGDFTVILIGKDGGEKLRSRSPIPWDRLAATIDAMPMRQAEVRRRQAGTISAPASLHWKQKGVPQ